MKYEWDEHKRSTNIAHHGIDFAAIARFDWDGATIFTDHRRDYGEARRVAYGYIGTRLIAVVYTTREANTRIISMRKANSREVRDYG
ncbi:MAG: BrnT family toxin [Mariprofundales bacterium]